jgi:hypothetical protein
MVGERERLCDVATNYPSIVSLIDGLLGGSRDAGIGRASQLYAQMPSRMAISRGRTKLPQLSKALCALMAIRDGRCTC